MFKDSIYTPSCEWQLQNACAISLCIILLWHIYQETRWLTSFGFVNFILRDRVPSLFPWSNLKWIVKHIKLFRVYGRKQIGLINQYPKVRNKKEKIKIRYPFHRVITLIANYSFTSVAITDGITRLCNYRRSTYITRAIKLILRLFSHSKEGSGWRVEYIIRWRTPVARWNNKTLLSERLSIQIVKDLRRLFKPTKHIGIILFKRVD